MVRLWTITGSGASQRHRAPWLRARRCGRHGGPRARRPASAPRRTTCSTRVGSKSGPESGWAAGRSTRWRYRRCGERVGDGLLAGTTGRRVPAGLGPWCRRTVSSPRAARRRAPRRRAPLRGLRRRRCSRARRVRSTTGSLSWSPLRTTSGVAHGDGILDNRLLAHGSCATAPRVGLRSSARLRADSCAGSSARGAGSRPTGLRLGVSSSTTVSSSCAGRASTGYQAGVGRLAAGWVGWPHPRPGRFRFAWLGHGGSPLLATLVSVHADTAGSQRP